ncbi:unnamed protein product [Vitrella brassicaformis CCMP3155]|uniref:protein disulfide-isomerase n=2 Tax=Vitrella brassicaformis TaxID=1169539 RepID=A0A0G4FHH0_VITBC|nr:unnamed protein product [Vitrella brassicaformis CCMP3155]|eukprot:CEM12748.1 unnamed protein product [Vitrella brassicaformis CCMP3155]
MGNGSVNETVGEESGSSDCGQEGTNETQPLGSSELKERTQLSESGESNRRLRRAMRLFDWTPETENAIKRDRVKTLLLMFYDAEADYALRCETALEHVAYVFRAEQILHVYVSIDNLASFRSLLRDDPETDAPFALILERRARFRKYLLEAPAHGEGLIGVDIMKTRVDLVCSPNSLAAFAQAYFDGKLSPWLRSEEAYDESDDTLVRQLVGRQFDHKVMASNVDVLVFFYAPWCGHCKRFEAKFRQLAERLRNVKTLEFYKMDMTRNDVQHPSIDIDRVPYVRLFPADDKTDVRVFDHSQSDVLAYGTQFLLNEVSIVIDLEQANRERMRQDQAKQPETDL